MNVRQRYFTTVLLVSLSCFVPITATAEEQKGASPTAQTAVTPDSKVSAPAPSAANQPATGQIAVPVAEQASGAETGAEASGPYTIKQGDTLWDISAQFLKDPFLWPLIWKVNPSISNPDLIYPGNALVIPSLTPIEQAISAPEPPKEAEAEPKAAAEPTPAPRKEAPVVRESPSELPFQGKRRLQVGEEKQEKAVSHLILPEEAAPPIIDRYAMLSAGFVSRDDESRDVVVGAMVEKTIYSYDDTILIKMHPGSEVNIGDKMLVYEQGKKVKHPATGKYFGKLTKVNGIIQVTAKEPSGIISGKVTLSFDTIEKGDRATPYVEPSANHAPSETRSKDITGYILAVRYDRILNGQLDFVYLDKGAADGVEQGDVFTVYLDPEKRGYPKKVIGEGQVFLVKDRTATAFIRKSTDWITTGNHITFKQ